MSENDEATATVELTAREVQVLTCAMAGNFPESLADARMPVLRKLAKVRPDDRPPDHIYWYDEPETNSRWYIHVGCDGGQSKYMVPLDDCLEPNLPDEECGHCCYVRPLFKGAPGSPHA